MLDPRQRFRSYVRLCEKGIAIIMISSELPEILGMSDRVMVAEGRADSLADLTRREARKKRDYEISNLIRKERYRRKDRGKQKEI